MKGLVVGGGGVGEVGEEEGCVESRRRMKGMQRGDLSSIIAGGGMVGVDILVGLRLRAATLSVAYSHRALVLMLLEVEGKLSSRAGSASVPNSVGFCPAPVCALR